MELLLYREKPLEVRTLGSILINSIWECFILEDKDRYLESGGVKVPKQTAIPRGRYRLVLDWSKRFQRIMPHILDVPQFDGIRIHWGHTEADTEGCPITGQRLDPDNTIHDSKKAFDALFAKLEIAQNSGEEMWIEVR